MVFRLAFLYSFYVFPAWFILREFSVEAIPALLGTYFSVLILLIVFLIRLRKFINGRTDRAVNAAKSPARQKPLKIEQSFTFRDYIGLNAEVMLSYLRPYMSILVGLAFLVLFGVSLNFEFGIIKTVLAMALALYLLTMPWILFLLKIRRVYGRSKFYLENQNLTITEGEISVQAGPSSDREFEYLDDIAVTPNYLLLFIAGSNYLQIMRHKLDNDGESFILNTARGMVLAKGALGA
jgi:hypothetical protein